MSEENKTGSFSAIPDLRSIPELQSMLRKKLGDDLIVEKQTVTDFLLPGENYGSLIVKIDAIVRRSEKTEKNEELHLIGKTPPQCPEMRIMAASSFTFKKESYMYDTVLPMYKKFERDCGVSEEDIFDIGPKFYGSRLSIGSDEVFDDNAIILLENLKIHDYYMGDRFTGLDLHHARLAVEAMARFHAIGIGIKIKDPEYFEILKVKAECLPMPKAEEFIEMTKGIGQSLQADPVIGEHFLECLKAVQHGFANYDFTAIPEEPWSTIVHSDFWINNIMFHRDEKTGLPDNIKFVDFQNFLFLSPLRELTFFLGTSVDHQVSENNIEQLLDLYHETLMARLIKMGCDTEPYARNKFDEKLVKDAYIEFGHSVVMLKITTQKMDSNDPGSKNIKNALIADGSEMFTPRLRDLVKGYKKRRWM